MPPKLLPNSFSGGASQFLGPLKQPETDEEPGFSGKFNKNQFEDQLKLHGSLTLKPSK